MTVRSYQQNCALAVALDLIGERWTLLLIRELMLGARRFTQLQRNLPGVGTNLLSERLARLTDLAIVRRQKEPGEHPAYQLTDLGRELEPAVYALIRWGNHFPERRRSAGHSRAEWNLLPLRAYFHPKAGARWRGNYRFSVDGEEIVIGVIDGRLEPLSGNDVAGDIHLDAMTAARLATGDISVTQAMESGGLVVSGSEEDIQRFFAAFAPDGAVNNAEGS